MTYQFLTLENGRQRARTLSIGSGGGGDSRVKINFSYGDATPAVIYVAPSDQIIYTVAIVIQTPFNGSNPLLRIGVSGNLSLLMSEFQNNPSEEGTYEVNPSVSIAAGTEILLSITPGFGPVQGNGFVILEV